jgi:cytochrome c556
MALPSADSEAACVRRSAQALGGHAARHAAALAAGHGATAASCKACHDTFRN